MQGIRLARTRYWLAGLCLVAPLFFILNMGTAQATGEVRLTTGTTDEYRPAVSGNKVTWLRGFNYGTLAYYSDVMYYEMGGSASKVSTVKSGYAPAISQTDVVWEDKRNNNGSFNTDTFGYPLASGPETAIETQTENQLWPTTDGGRTVWQDNRNGLWDIYMKDTNGSTYRISIDPNEQTEPRIDGDLIVWTDDRHAGGLHEVYVYDLSVDSNGNGTPNYKEGSPPNPDPAETRITNHPAKQNDPDISGRKITWTDWRSGRDIYYYDLDNPVTNGAPLNSNAAFQHSARISGDLVVWTDWRNTTYPNGTNQDIYAKNLASGRVTQVTTDGRSQLEPDVSNGRMVWSDNRSNHWDIYTKILMPSGSIKINNGAANTRSRSVTLNLTATDGGSGLDMMQFKNSGGGWTSWESVKSSKSWTLPSGDGTKRVYYRIRDRAGNAIYYSDTIVLDTVRPSLVKLTTPFVSTRISKTTTFKITWSGSDALSGMGTYLIRYRPANSSIWKTWKTSSRSSYAYFKGTAGRTYYFRAKGMDKVGNYRWSKIYKTILPYNEGANMSKRVGFNGYQKKGKSQNYLTSVRYSYGRGQYIKYKVHGNAVGLVTTKYKNRGRAKIYIDGKYVKTVDAKSSKMRPRQLIFYKSWKTKRTHYIKIVNMAPPGRARFDIDGLVVGR